MTLMDGDYSHLDDADDDNDTTATHEDGEDILNTAGNEGGRRTRNGRDCTARRHQRRKKQTRGEVG
jgi:hypothetical protein